MEKKKTKPLSVGYKPNLAKPDRDNNDVKADAQWLADREKIRNKYATAAQGIISP